MALCLEFDQLAHEILDLIWFECALAALLLKTLLYAVQDLNHEVAVVDTEELCQLRSPPSASLERRLLRRRREHEAPFGLHGGHGHARGQRPPALCLRGGRGRRDEAIVVVRRLVWLLVAVATQVVVQLGQGLLVVLVDDVVERVERLAVMQVHVR